MEKYEHISVQNQICGEYALRNFKWRQDIIMEKIHSTVKCMMIYGGKTHTKRE